MSVRVQAGYLQFIESERVSLKTRELLEARMSGPRPTQGVLTAAQETTLRAMLARVVPQEGEVEDSIDLAGFLLAQLESGRGDGWRYAVLPPDLKAYREGLDRLSAQGFAGLSMEAQDSALHTLEAEEGSAAARWFEEVRGAATTAYVAHPRTLARIGYSGIGVGGAGTKYKGFVALQPDEREAWEPVASVGEKR